MIFNDTQKASKRFKVKAMGFWMGVERELHLRHQMMELGTLVMRAVLKLCKWPTVFK